ncbi:MAG TPA: YbjN domain-containing protein [Xanthomonadaceae bacterium]|nr:YbjN domain-containing protein [Xanthomonadaceae bacterium]
MLPRVLALLLFALLLAPAAQSSDLIEKLDGRTVRSILGDLGFTGSEIDTDDDVIVSMQGYRVLVVVGSDKGRSLMARFAISGTGATLRSMNDWNRTKRYSRAYLDDDGDPVLESDLDLDGGVHRKRVEDFFRTFDGTLRLFLRHIE